MLKAFLKLKECNSVYLSELAIITVIISYPVYLLVSLQVAFPDYGQTGKHCMCVFKGKRI